MERLEILGDVFLKYSVGIRLFGNKEYSSLAEGVLSQKRSQIVGNKRLYKTAIKQDFPSLISAQKFEPYLNFMAPRFSQKDGLEETICKMDEEFTSKSRLLSTKGDISDGSSKTGQHDITSQSITQLLTQDDVKTLSDSNMDQETQEKLIRLALSRYQDEFSTNRHNRYSLRQYVRINDKSLADTVESLLGCYLEHSGQIGALICMKHLGLDEKGRFEKADLPEDALLPHCMENDNERKMAKEKLDILLSRINVAEVEKIIGYTFKEKSFVLQSLTHASYITNGITPSYERLEFLGDAVLDYLITCYLYTYGDGEIDTPGIITNLRSALVNNNVSRDHKYAPIPRNKNL